MLELKLETLDDPRLVLQRFTAVNSVLLFSETAAFVASSAAIVAFSSSSIFFSVNRKAISQSITPPQSSSRLICTLIKPMTHIAQEISCR